MKVLLKKIKKTKLSVRLIYLFKSLILLNNIETKLRIIVLCVLLILLIVYAFIDLLLLLTKKNKTVVVTSFIVVLISAISIIGSLAINKAYVLLSSLNKEKILYTTNLISLNNTEFLNNASYKVGIINNETDVEGNVLAYE